MHSFTGPSGRTYSHNGDFSGDVQWEVQVGPSYEVPVEIPFEDIRALYLAYLRQERIARLEAASDDDLEAGLLR